MLTDFRDEEQGAFFTTAKDHESLIVRAREGADAIPSGMRWRIRAGSSQLSFRPEDREAPPERSAHGRQIARHPRPCEIRRSDLLPHGPAELRDRSPGEPPVTKGSRPKSGSHAELDHRASRPGPKQPTGPATQHPLLVINNSSTARRPLVCQLAPGADQTRQCGPLEGPAGRTDPAAGGTKFSKAPVFPAGHPGGTRPTQ
jgi:hypothetical protein